MEDGLSIGCAQVVPCAVRKEASSSSIGKPVLWVQCLCVTPTSRAGQEPLRALMAWAEREASSAAQASGVSDAEIWLAVQEANNAARSLYEGLGFVNDEVVCGWATPSCGRAYQPRLRLQGTRAAPRPLLT